LNFKNQKGKKKIIEIQKCGCNERENLVCDLEFYTWENIEKFADAAEFTERYVGYSESKYRLRVSLAHPRHSHFAHVQ